MVKEFLKWAKAHNIKLKRYRDQEAAYQVWKALKAESAEREAALNEKIKSLGAALNELDQERIKLNGW